MIMLGIGRLLLDLMSHSQSKFDIEQCKSWTAQVKIPYQRVKNTCIIT